MGTYQTPKPILAPNKPLQIEVKSGSFTKLDVPETIARRSKTYSWWFEPISKIFVKIGIISLSFQVNITNIFETITIFGCHFFGWGLQLVRHHGGSTDIDIP